MSYPTGGLRKRLIKDNLFNLVNNKMTDLGWFSNTLSEYNVDLIEEQLDSRQEITPNKISFSTEDSTNESIELGSNLTEDSWEVYFDIFAENQAVGVHISGDIYSILKKNSNFSVYDLTQTGQPYLFSCEIDDIETARVREWERPYNKYWWTVGCVILDTYYEGD